MRRALPALLMAALLAGCGENPGVGDVREAPGSRPGPESPGVDTVPPPAADPVVSRDPLPVDDTGTGSSGGRAGAGASGAESEPAAPVFRPPPPPVELPDEDDRPRFRRPEHIRGLYLNAWTAGSSRRVEQLVDLARRTEVNSFVIDLKDASGFVSYATGVELAREIGAAGQIRIRDLPALLARLDEEGIYPIARIVIVKDPLLVAARPELAVQDTAGGVWVDGKGFRWLNPFDERVWEYHLALAEEAVALGFPEVQWDYVRFPDAPRAEIMRASYPGRDGRPRTDAVRAFLERSRERLGAMDAVVTADVFGVTTSAGDVGIGQVWESFIDVVDVALPMVYPSHYWRGSFGVERPNAFPYEIVKHALERGVARSKAVEGAGAIAPWLQDFSLGEPSYGAPEVRAQIQATYDAGIGDWILWNPGSRYTEEALEPSRGWRREPRIRVAGEVVRVSDRHDALRRRAERIADSLRVVVPATEVKPDTTRRGGGSP